MSLKTPPISTTSANDDTRLELADIQGLVLRGYSYYTIRHFIFKIRDDVAGGVAGARTLCQALKPGSGAPLTITTAKPWKKPPPYCLNIGITNSGLAKLIGQKNYDLVKGATTTIFDSFDNGSVNQASTVGDIGSSAPQNWWPVENWKLPSPPSTADLDLVISLYTRNQKDRDAFAVKLLAMIPNAADKKPALVPAFIQDADPLPLPSGSFPGALQIHFGYADGFSQPRIQGTPWDDPGDPHDDSPLVPSWNFAISTDAPFYNAHQLLVNGCFGAFRLLYQDVEAFNNFLEDGTSQVHQQSPELLAAKMCGRWLDGTPLEVSPDKPDPMLKVLDLTNFNYINATTNQKGPKESDDSGQLCPYASHTRRTNPRDDAAVIGNSDPSTGKALNATNNRVRRFATPYGPAYTPQTRDAQRGLVGFFMGANMSEQFDFLMQTWINSSGFRQGADASPNSSGVDPLFGTQAEDPNPLDFEFAYCTTPPSTYATVPNMTRFIVTKGGLYVFLPSISALDFLAQGVIPNIEQGGRHGHNR